MILEKEFSSTNDFLANKSVLGALFEINDSSKLFLFTAHVQAAGTLEHKLFQLNQIGDFIMAAVKETVAQGIVNDPTDLSVILAGDFNSNAYSMNRFNSFMKALKYPRDLHKEFHGSNEEYTFRNRPRRYDYILAYDKVGEINLKKVNIKSINVDNVQDDNGENISDHKAIKATLLFNQNMVPDKCKSKFIERFSK
jgi:endonuclease/exonuclease/phosphatase family metal-dependent hydrolase